METIVTSTMEPSIKNWWVSFLIGFLFLFAGFWVFLTPVESYLTLNIVFSAFILVSGVFEMAFALSNRAEIRGWGWYMVGGLLDLIIGGLLLAHPVMTMEILPFYVGFWLLFRSIMAIGFAFSLNADGAGDWGWLLMTGLLTLIFSILLLINPVFTGLSIVYMTGFAFVSIGIFRVLLAFDLKKVNKSTRTTEVVEGIA